MDNNNWLSEILLEEIIEATRGMDPQEYLEFMELPGPDRLERVKEILRKAKERKDDDGTN